jgi:hypothetical protein
VCQVDVVVTNRIIFQNSINLGVCAFTAVASSASTVNASNVVAQSFVVGKVALLLIAFFIFLKSCFCEIGQSDHCVQHALRLLPHCRCFLRALVLQHRSQRIRHRHHN